jgi:CDP-glycerol glycerophosphotransferase (TagB/SpsB family)
MGYFVNVVEMVGSDAIMFILKLASGLIGWLFISPIALLMPRRKDYLAVIGREDGKFLDNAKYFFLQGNPLLAPDVRMVFVTERDDVKKILIDSDYEGMIYPSMRSIWFLLRCGTVVVDSAEWFGRLRRFFLVKAKIVQLWHGVGFKRIELDRWRNEADSTGFLSTPLAYRVRLLAYRVTGRLVRYDIVNTTSVFYRDQVFALAFKSKYFPVTGYPRNTFGEIGSKGKVLAWKNVDPVISILANEWATAGRRIVLIAPTFRDSGAAPLSLTPNISAMLDVFCEEHGIEIVFKFHPAERNLSFVQGRHLHLCDPTSDLYPLMPYSSAMVTDYSSIYMDYLLLGKPVIFLTPDIDRYVSTERQVQFDFEKMSPGPKVATWKELSTTLIEQLQNDTYIEARENIRKLAFGDFLQVMSVPSLIELMYNNGYLRSSLPSRK